MKKSMFSRFLKTLLATVRYRIGGCVLVNAWVQPSLFGIERHNLGDDINKPLIESLSGKHVSFVNKVKYKDEHLIAIGSVVDSLTTEDSIIWGGGYLSNKKDLPHKPKKVCAVRGPLTRNVLISYGVECPEVYGDPALLMPLIYNPPKNKKYNLGIIPHFHDYNTPQLESFRTSNPDVLFINMGNYESWRDVIDKICSCERIISSSLHGLILSDAYKIPNVYVQFSDMVEGGEFKFKDYMGGVGRMYQPPVDYKESIDLKKLDPIFNTYRIIEYDYRILLQAFPYHLSYKFQRIIS